MNSPSKKKKKKKQRVQTIRSKRPDPHGRHKSVKPKHRTRGPLPVVSRANSHSGAGRALSSATRRALPMNYSRKRTPGHSLSGRLISATEIEYRSAAIFLFLRARDRSGCLYACPGRIMTGSWLRRMMHLSEDFPPRMALLLDWPICEWRDVCVTRRLSIFRVCNRRVQGVLLISWTTFGKFEMKDSLFCLRTWKNDAVSLSGEWLELA